MKKLLLLLLLSFSFFGIAQEFKIKKGAIINAIPVKDSVAENFALYLPSSFDISKKWPIVFVFDMQGRGMQALSMYRQAAEEQGYILAASNNIHDSISLSKNILITSRMFNSVYSTLPIKRNRVYTSGFLGGARLATLVPAFIKEVQGVISFGSAVANQEVLSSANRFHFIGVVGIEDFNYLPMLENQKVLNRLKFPNQLMIFNGGQTWPESKYIAQAMEMLTIAAMNKGIENKDQTLISSSYNRNLGEVSTLLASQNPLRADNALNDIISSYRNFKNIDSLKASSKTLRRTKAYRINKRNQNATFFKERLIQDDYSYYLEEDILSYNYNNLGWWQYQMEELKKYESRVSIFEKQMAKRLKSFLNALIEDNLDAIKIGKPVNEEAMLLLWMIKTITDSKNFSTYLKIISLSAKVEDYGTSLFYLEELLKAGYKDKKELYTLENTALFRITPEFNTLVEKYLKDARYETIEE